MNIRLLLFLCLSVITNLYAQQVEISGTIISSEDDLPVIGANIILKGQNAGTSSDFDGNYVITANIGDILQYSYLGFETQEIVVGNQKSVLVTLVPDADALDEVVVIGYGVQKKKEVTGAVSILDAKTIEKLNPVRIEQALQGQISGVNITSASGSPGSGLNIRIRGISTNGDSRPLILVDGNVIEDLSVINPNDIKSVNVLKDATAGIYGVRATNGVILIETKTGRKNSKLKVSLDSYIGFQTMSKKINLINNAYDYATYINEASVNGGGMDRFIPVESTRLVFNTNDFLNPILTNTDWQDEVFKVAPIKNINVNFNGGTEKLTYSFGASFLNQDGIVGLDKSGYSRTTARLNIQYDLLKNLNLSVTGIYTNSTKNNLPEGGIGSVLYSALNIDPFTTVRSTDPNGNGYGETLVSAREVVNPVALIENTYDKTRIDKLSATFGLDYTIIEGLNFNTKFQFNHAAVLTDIFRPVFNYGSGKQGTIEDDPFVIKDDGNALTDNIDFYDDYIWDNYLTYSNTFNENHNLTALLGMSFFETKGLFTGRSGRGLINNRNTIEDALFAYVPPENIRSRYNADQLEAGNDRFISRLFSVFSRVQYNYKGKYLLSAVIRRDGSSNFGPANKFGYFPSGSIGWNISEEEFLTDNAVLSYLKLRASYGATGNDKIGSNRFISLLNGEALYTNNDETDADDVLIGKAIGGLSNPEIRWESTTSANIGVDMKFLNNDLSISADVFSKKTEDLLVQANVSGTLGAAAPGSSSPFINAGDVENKGFEFLVTYNKSISSDFNFNVSYNFSTLHNEVLFVGSTEGFLEGGSFLVGENLMTSRMEAGFPIGYFHGYKTNGVYQDQAEINVLNADAPTGTYHSSAKPGDLKFVDVDGDGEITVADKTYIGDPIADLTMGLNLGFNYKNIDFNASAFASIGNDLVRDYERKNLFSNKGTYALDRWSTTNPSNAIPRAVNGSSVSYDNFSDYFVEDASYVRVQNIQIGYTFNEKLLSKLGIGKFRVYASGNNLFTFTKYRGYDPSAIGGGTDGRGEPIGSGIDKGFYPVAKTYLLGMNLNF